MTKTVADFRHEPWIRLTRRDAVPFWKKILVRVIAVLLALVAAAIFLYCVTGLNPVDVYKTMFKGSFGTKRKFFNMLRDMSTLLCVGIALAPAFKMRFWNIGGEGQVLMGALATAMCMIYLGSQVPSWLLYVTMVLGSMFAGALWAFFPAFCKSRWNTNETLFTLMMNYVAIQIVACFTNIMRGQNSSMGLINQTTRAGWLPKVFGYSFMINLLVVAALMILMFLYLRYSKHGYEIAVVGESENTARYAGINVRRVTIRTMLISGAICGICGFLIVAGRDYTIATTTAGGTGFTAIIVAWLAKFNTFYMALISFILTFLGNGAGQIASDFKLNQYASDIVTGIILFFILGSEFFINYKLVFRSKKLAAGEVQS